MKLPDSMLYTVGGTDGFLNPGEVFTDRVGLLTHCTFRERILPVLQPSEVASAVVLESVSLAPLLDITGKRYPRDLRKYVVPRYEPNSQDIATYFRSRNREILVGWQSLAQLLRQQSKGEPGPFTTRDVCATFLFMQGAAEEVFLVRAFWYRNLGGGCWSLRAWGLNERVQRGWDTSKNRLLLPVAQL
jgi:hypothetical protein